MCLLLSIVLKSASLTEITDGDLYGIDEEYH